MPVLCTTGSNGSVNISSIRSGRTGWQSLRGLHRLFDYQDKMSAELFQVDLAMQRGAEGAQSFARAITLAVEALVDEALKWAQKNLAK